MPLARGSSACFPLPSSHQHGLHLTLGGNNKAGRRESGPRRQTVNTDGVEREAQLHPMHPSLPPPSPQDSPGVCQERSVTEPEYRAIVLLVSVNLGKGL